MKVVLFRVLLFLLLFWGFPGVSFGQFFLNWNYFDLFTDVQQSGARPDLEMDVAGNFHMIYWNQLEDIAVYGYRPANSGQWSFERIDPGTENGYRCAISLDNTGTPHVAYFSDNGGVIELRYARRSGPGNWAIESIPGPPKGWGEYGPSSPTITAEFIKPALDIAINPLDQSPKIVLFNHYFDMGNRITCGGSSYYNDYELRVYNCFKQAGVWKYHSFGEYADHRKSCGGFALPHGDRYGEWATITVKPDGTQQVVCNAYFNREILMITSQGNDTTWQLSIADSAFGMCPSMLTSPSWSWLKPYYFSEGQSSFVDADGNTHMSWAGGIAYGNNFYGPSAIFNNLVYQRVDTGGNVFQYQFYPGTLVVLPHMTNTYVHARSAEKIMLSFNNKSSGAYVVAISADSGNTWEIDTLLLGSITTGPAPIRSTVDSVFILLHDGLNERMILASKAWADSVWIKKEITQSQARGASLDGDVRNRATDTLIGYAFNDGYQGDLFYSQGVRSGGNLNWITEAIDTQNELAASVSFAFDSNDQPMALYTVGLRKKLRFAHKNAGVWSYQYVDTLYKAVQTDLLVGPGDTLHIAFFDILTGSLYYGKKQLFDPTWSISLVDSANAPTGEFPSLALAPDGKPRISYFQSFYRYLRFAELTAAGWISDTAFYVYTNSAGQYSKQVTLSNGNTMVAHTGNVTQRLMVSQRDSLGIWSTMTLDSGNVTNMGHPTDLVLDDLGYPWLAYNTEFGSERIKLLKRSDTAWHEINVSTQGFLGNSFAFRVAGEDLYIIGRKNQVGDRGIAMLYAGNGLYVKLEDAKDQVFGSIVNFPNPFSRTTSFLVNLPSRGNVSLDVYDLMGNRVARLLENQPMNEGQHKIGFNAEGLSPGVYLYRLQTEEKDFSGKMILVN